MSVRNDRQSEEFTTLLKEKDDQIAQLLEEGNDGINIYDTLIM